MLDAKTVQVTMTVNSQAEFARKLTILQALDGKVLPHTFSEKNGKFYCNVQFQADENASAFLTAISLPQV